MSRNEGPTSVQVPGVGAPVLALGFRVFFLLGALSAVLLVPVWMLVYGGGFAFSNHFDLLQWHAHEMLFGFATAIIAGFLLTAPGAWTGRPMPHGAVLGWLAALWVAGRVVCYVPTCLPAWLIALVDAAFLPVLAGAVILALRGAPQQRHNLVFPVLLAGMTTANLLAHAGIRNARGVPVGTELMLYLVLVLIAILGGRVIPAFTRNRFPQGATRVRPWVNWAAIGALVVLIPADLMCAPVTLITVLCLAAAVLHGLRLAGWYTREIWRDPLLWILHVGYGWMVVGFLMKAGAGMQVAPPLLFRHAFTAGTIGVIIFGMICRVTLGHTGRPLRPPRLIPAAFLAINVAVLFRVVLPWLDPGHYLLWLSVSATAWVLAFGVYLVQQGPMLWTPRVDGQPG